MKVLLILSARGANRAANVEIYNLLKQQVQDLTWCSGSGLDLYKTVPEGFLYLQPVDAQSPKEQPTPLQLPLNSFDIAIIDQSLDLTQDQAPAMFGGGIANRSLDFEGNDRPCEIAQELTRLGVVCIGTSRDSVCLHELATEGHAVLTCPLEELVSKLPSLMSEAERLVNDNQCGGALKALTLRQPFDWAIFGAGKDVENRDWPTNVRGTIAIHASETQPDGYFDNAVRFVRKVLRSMWKLGVQIPSHEQMPKGAIIGLVDVVDCVEDGPSAWFEGPHGFTLANPRLLPTPIACQGKRRFFTVPGDVETQVRTMLPGAFKAPEQR